MNPALRRALTQEEYDQRKRRMAMQADKANMDRQITHYLGDTGPGGHREERLTLDGQASGTVDADGRHGMTEERDLSDAEVLAEIPIP